MGPAHIKQVLAHACLYYYVLTHKWCCSALTSTGQGAFPMAVLHAAMLFWQEENGAVWPSAVLYQLAFRLRNCPCLLFIGFHYLFQLQILLWSNNRFWKKEYLKGTHKIFMAESNFDDYCKLEWFMGCRICVLWLPISSLSSSLLGHSFQSNQLGKQRSLWRQWESQEMNINRVNQLQSEEFANDVSKAPSFGTSHT